MFQAVSNQSANRFAVTIFIRIDFSGEEFVELFNFRERLHTPTSVLGIFQDIVGILIDFVEFIIDFAHDLLEHIFNRNQPGDAAKLIDHNGHVIALEFEVAQKIIQRHALRNKFGRTQMLTSFKGRINQDAQNGLSVQNADHVVTVIIQNDWETRVTSLDHPRQPNIFTFT